tara:strand:+ start:705 stop:965 length:261 start_codon:yes stop_codon:yes gene_type:complete
MFDLLSSAIKLADKILDVHTLHQKNKYKRKLHKLKKELQFELEKPDHLKVDSIIDDLNFELSLLLNVFSEEITSKNIQNKNIPPLH